VIVFALIATAVGLLWNPRLWLVSAAIFYGIFTVLYTSLFTNGFGFMTGLVGSLGYWLEQQGVNRGSQPWYYYGFLQLPIYEYLPYLGTILALIFAPRLLRLTAPQPSEALAPAEETPADFSEEAETGAASEIEPAADTPLPGVSIALFLFWSFSSLMAYSIAGEKMPWLTVHITLGMILSTAWFLGKLVETTDWEMVKQRRGVIVLLLLAVFLVSTIATLASLLGVNPPFQGKELDQLQGTSTFLFALITALLTGWGLIRLTLAWKPGQLIRLLTLTVFACLSLLTARAAIMAAYINYDMATEYLVYAHSAPGVKLALAQIEEISRRTTDGLGINVAYDSDTSYPYWWYLRNYPNKVFYGSDPTRSLRESPVILVGEGNFGKIEPVVGQAYDQFDYIRLWWPNQDYFGLTLDRITSALTNPQMRQALFDIWLNRDYTLYGQVTNKDLSLANWYPSSKMRLYIRKDVAASLWNYGASPAPQELVADPYEGKNANLLADQVIGVAGSEAGQFKRQRDLAVAPDGGVYVADTENHRIQHFDPQGNFINTWGSYGASIDANNPAPEGSFNEPWGIAVGPDGSVYVADTWNNRIQKFDANGKFITSWGFGISQTDDPFGFYGPRDVAVDGEGNVFVTDTGNKRVVVFDADGNFLTQFGGPGLDSGQFDEPVGVTVDAQGQVYVADTWNQRVQVFLKASDGSYLPLESWDIAGWYGQSLDNKPYLDVNDAGKIFIADPEANRVLMFNTQGEFIQYWGDYSTGPDGFNLVGSVQADNSGGVWVSDTNNNRIMHFSLEGAP
jgi:streptogramin lyase